MNANARGNETVQVTHEQFCFLAGLALLGAVSDETRVPAESVLAVIAQRGWLGMTPDQIRAELDAARPGWRGEKPEQ